MKAELRHKREAEAELKKWILNNNKQIKKDFNLESNKPQDQEAEDTKEKNL